MWNSTTPGSTTLAPRTAGVDPGPRVTLWVLRAVAVVVTAALAAQPLLAGIYLDGNVRAVVVHGNNGHLLTGLLFLQLLAVLGYRLVGRGAGWPLHANITLLLAANLQVGFGYAGLLAVHAPLGIAILACQLGITIWLWTPRARRVHPARRARGEQHGKQYGQQDGEQPGEQRGTERQGAEA